MKLFRKMKDGGKDSFVTGYWLIEWKPVFSIVLLRFSTGSRNVYHDHAFNCFSWLLKGKLMEEHLGKPTNYILPSIIPFMTYRSTFHKVTSYGTSWVLSFRSPWADTWNEFNPETYKHTILTKGRKIMPL